MGAAAWGPAGRGKGCRVRRRWCCAALATLVLGLSLAPAAGGTGPVRQPMELRADPRLVLEAVARHMNVVLRREIPLPAIRFESTTPLARFQDAMQGQWGFRPQVFVNAYAVASNEIYLTDDAAYYVRLGRSLDESLAHEYAHYIQVRYLKADLADEGCELQAIAVQMWVRGLPLPAFRRTVSRVPGIE